MATSTGKRLNDLPQEEQGKDGMSVFKPADIAKPPSNHGNHRRLHTKPAPPSDPKEVQNNESSSTDEDLPKGQQNNNGNYGKTFDDVKDSILPMS